MATVGFKGLIECLNWPFDRLGSFEYTYSVTS